jgi:hypothetical protein
MSESYTLILTMLMLGLARLMPLAAWMLLDSLPAYMQALTAYGRALHLDPDDEYSKRMKQELVKKLKDR